MIRSLKQLFICAHEPVSEVSSSADLGQALLTSAGSLVCLQPAHTLAENGLIHMFGRWLAVNWGDGVTGPSVSQPPSG